MFEAIERLAVNDALGIVMDLVGATNRYLEATAPWTRAKAGETGRVHDSVHRRRGTAGGGIGVARPPCCQAMACSSGLGCEPRDPRRADLVWDC